MTRYNAFTSKTYPQRLDNNFTRISFNLWPGHEMYGCCPINEGTVTYQRELHSQRVLLDPIYTSRLIAVEQEASR